MISKLNSRIHKLEQSENEKLDSVEYDIDQKLKKMKEHIDNKIKSSWWSKKKEEPDDYSDIGLLPHATI